MAPHRRTTRRPSAASDLARQLEAPNPEDPAHDPGTVVAGRRAEAAGTPAPAGIDVRGTRIVCGVAGWTDPTLTAPGVFYPERVRSPEERLRHYSSLHPLVEVDSPFYAMPTGETATLWAERTPSHFAFDVKAFSLLTGHAGVVARMPEWLRSALTATQTRRSARVYERDLPRELMDEVWRRFLGALEPLASVGKLGAVLLQFPRWFTPTRQAADYLIAARERLGTTRGAVEFRNPEWVQGRITDRTFALLTELGLSYVNVDAPPGTRSSMPPIVRQTSPELAVFRLHGRRTATWEARNDPVSERYRYLYDREQLVFWAARVRELVEEQRPKRVHIVWNNCHANYGTTNAAEFEQLLLETFR